jgi:hypothetical protein
VHVKAKPFAEKCPSRAGRRSDGPGRPNGTAPGGETVSIYMIDVDGTLVEIELNRDGTQTPAELEEAYAIIASLQITRCGRRPDRLTSPRALPY